MALIGKIRKNFWIVLILLAMALASFVIMDVMGSRSGSGFFGNPTTVGKVAGQKIDYTDFQKTENALYSGSDDVYGRRNMVWDYFVEKAIVEKQADALGLGVSKDELMELQFGNNLSSVVQNNFRDPSTGGVNRQQLLQFKQAIEAEQDLAPQFKTFWAEQEKQVIKTSLQDKIAAMISKAIIAPKWQTEVVNQLNNDKITFEFVRVGFDKVDDKEVNLTDDDYKNFLAKNPGKYNLTDENRMIDYVAVNVTPTKDDTIKVVSKLQDLKSGFRTSTNDSLFTLNNGGAVLPAYQKADALTGALKDSVSNMGIGSVVGPYLDNGAYLLAKLIDKRIIPDSVKARHILRKVDNPATLAIAKKQIDSLKNLLVTKRVRFDSLAIKNSEDTGSAIKGGDLGTFAEGAMVKPFNDACFKGNVGSYYVVETQFGVHLIEVLNQKYLNKNPKYKIAIVAESMIPSQATQDAVYDKVSGILAKTKNLEDLKKLGEKDPELKVQTTKGLTKNDYVIQPFQGDASRDMIKWAYGADINDVSKDIFNFQDENKQYTKTYILAGLNSISKPGLMTVTQAKTQIEALVKNFKKAEILKGKIKGTDMSAIATEFGTVIDTAVNVTFSQGAIASIRANEPKLIAKAFSMEPGKTSAIIEGNSGLFMIKVKEKTPAIPESNMDMIKTSIVNSAKSGAGYRIWDALKKKYKPEDNRSSFY